MYIFLFKNSDCFLPDNSISTIHSKKSTTVRNAKSIGNMSRNRQESILKNSNYSKFINKESNLRQTKNRSKSVDGRFRSFFCTNSSIINIKQNKNKFQNPTKLTKDDTSMLKTFKYANNLKVDLFCSNNHLNSNRKSYDCLTKSETEKQTNEKKLYKRQLISTQLDFKELGKKNERERQRLSEMMSKLELELALAKKDLLDDDIAKSLEQHKSIYEKSKVCKNFQILEK